MKSSKPPIPTTLALAAMTALLVAACDKPAPPPTQPRLVKTLVVGSGESHSERHYAGEVRARYESLLGFRIGGKVLTRLVDAGALVRSGQALARLDPADAQLQLAQADAQRSLAEADLKRFRDLKEKNFISQSALDARETGFKAADAQRGLAHNQAAYTTLVADKSGVIAATLVEPGQVVSAGQPVVRLAQAGEREIAIALPEEAIRDLKPGATARVTLWTHSDKPFRGRLRELSPAADPATRLYAARITLVDAPADLPLGLSADVTFDSRDGAGLRVPISALLKQGEEVTVWVVDKEHKLVARKVTVRRYGDDGAWLSAGLEAGEVVVAAGGYKLFAGEVVRLADDINSH